LVAKSDRSKVSIHYTETIQGEKIMNLELYQQVYLNHDLPEYQLKKGDIATLIDFVLHPHNQEEGCILEVFNALGESIHVVAIPKSWVIPLQSNQIFSVRTLALAS
jgi:hypothetical protein